MKRIPLSRCVKCTHYRHGTGCVLEDLAPCQFRRTPEAEQERVKSIFFAVTAVTAVAFCALMWLADGRWNETPAQEPAPAPAQSVTAILREHHRPDTLTDWQLLQLAIIWTESKADPAAVGSAGDSGILQLRPVYVAEVNRVAGTDYRPEDAFDPATALEIFDKMQAHYNPERDRDTAIRYHNKGDGYRAAVLRNLELIRRYETARRLILETN